MRTILPKTPHVLLLVSLTAISASCGALVDTTSKTGKHTIIKRMPDTANGRAIFVDKGCIICHSVNGVGGKAAPPLDAQTEFDAIDPVEFAARMWRGAPAMVELQSLELGYTIWLEADDIADLAAFAADADEQKKLSIDQISPELQNSFLDQRFWEVENWDEFLKNGQEGFGEPPMPQTEEETADQE